MKQPKKPTREQKEKLSKRRYQWRNYSFVGPEEDKEVFVNKKTGKLIRL